MAPSLTTGAGAVHFLPSSDVTVPTRIGKTSGWTLTFVEQRGGYPGTGLRSVANPLLTEPFLTAPQPLVADLAWPACNDWLATNPTRSARPAAIPMHVFTRIVVLFRGFRS